MAAMAYFQKIYEDDTQVRYQYGPDENEMNSELSLEKESRRTTSDTAALGPLGRKAAGKITQLRVERGEWPDRGASFS